MFIQNLYNKMTDWYFGLPRWKKYLFFITLIGIVLVAFVYWIYSYYVQKPLTTTAQKVDSAHTAVIDNTIKQSEELQKKLEAELLSKKTEVSILAQKRIQGSEKQSAIQEAISNAKSFEELDALLRTLN